jgi:hypothetical protein
MKFLKIAGIGCLSLIVLLALVIFGLSRMIEPMSKKLNKQSEDKAKEMAQFFGKTNALLGGKFTELPLDSSIHDSTRSSIWEPKLKKYEEKFGKIKSIDSCWTIGNIKTFRSGFKEKNETVWGEFKCSMHTDSGKVEFEITGHKYSDVWKILNMKVDEKYILN